MKSLLFHCPVSAGDQAASPPCPQAEPSSRASSQAGSVSLSRERARGVLPLPGVRRPPSSPSRWRALGRPFPLMPAAVKAGNPKTGQRNSRADRGWRARREREAPALQRPALQREPVEARCPGTGQIATCPSTGGQRCPHAPAFPSSLPSPSPTRGLLTDPPHRQATKPPLS